MSKNHIMSFILLTGLALLAAGCGKQEPEGTAAPAATTTEQAGSNLQSAAKTAQDQARSVATTVSQSAQQAATEVKQEASKAVAQAESLLSQAKSLVTDKKYQDALNTLKQVSNLKLTPEQQKVLEDLQRQVQAGLASLGATNAAQKLGGFLGGKK